MAAAREVRLFLASSINEFHDERRELAAFLESLKSLYRDSFSLECILCDYQTSAAIPGGKQAYFNRLILQSQLFCMLVGKKLGDKTREEFDVAWKNLCETGAPVVLTYFQALPKEALEDSAREFLRYYREDLDQYSVPFAHIDTVKLNILLELQRGGWDNSLQARDGEIRVRGQALFPTENIPVFAKHRELARLREKETALAEEMNAPRAWEDSGEEKLFRLQTDMELEDTRTELHRLESELLNLCAAVQGDSPTTARGRQARALVEEGRAEEALALLRQGDPEAEVRSAEAMLALGLERVRALIDEDRLRIRLLEAQPVTPAITAELRATYARAAVLAERWQVEPKMVYDYVNFLWKEKDYKTAISIGERLRGWYERDGVRSSALAYLSNLMGILYDESKDYIKSRERYEEALNLWLSLDGTGQVFVKPDLAMTYNNLGNLFTDSRDLDNAWQYYSKALELFRSLASVNPALWEPNLATTCNNLGTLLSDIRDLKRAREYYEEAFKIRRRLASVRPAVYEPDLAATCDNLGTLLSNTGELENAQLYYKTALEIRSRLAEAHPAAYERDLAITFHNLGALLWDSGDPDSAWQFYSKALTIRRRLARAHPKAYEPDLAMTCNNIGNLLKDTGSPEEARQYYDEALEIRRRLAADHPTAYEPDLALTCNNLGVLLIKTGDFELARQYLDKALEIRRRLAAEHAAAYEPDLARTFNNLGILLKDTGDPEGSRQYYIEAVKIYSRLAAAHASAYEPALATIYNNLGTLLSETEDLHSAKQCYNKALEIRQRLAATHPMAYGPDLATTCNNLGALLSDTEDPGEARRHYDKALNIYRPLAAAHPEAYEPDLARTCFNYGLLEYKYGTIDQARVFFEEAEALWRKSPYTADRAEWAAEMIQRCEEAETQV